MRKAAWLVALLSLSWLSCPAAPTSGADGGVDGGATDAGPFDGGSADAGSTSGASDAGLDAGSAGAFDAGPAPTGELRPVPGEVTILQLELPVGVFVEIGEAAIIVGPTGTLVLVDVGNGHHDDEVREAVRELNTRWLTPARGFPSRAPLQVDWIILTHFHGDHVGGFDALTSGADALTVTGGVVHRGFTDVGPGVNEGDYESVCDALRGRLATRDVPLCVSAVPAPCNLSGVTSTFPATGCPGLRLGDLSRADDDAAGAPSFIDLGAGARLTLLGAGGWANGPGAAFPSAPFGVADSNEENGRSVSGLVSFGAFRYLFAGDLTGSGAPTEPDVESHLVTTAAPLLGPGGVDVAHANHHARKTSSNPTYVAALAPADGHTRHVVAGINTAYANSPHQEVLDAWGLGGRLAGGGFFVTRRAPAGATSPELVDAQGQVVIRTVEGGGGYWVQAPALGIARATPSVRR
ncbi:MAG: MBL fold metallo-hydrolase [Myxococcota bacterium]